MTLIDFKVEVDFVEMIDEIDPTCVTDPAHGGKVTCHKCNGFIPESQKYCFRGEMTIVWFHKDCFNVYEHYYGLDRPID